MVELTEILQGCQNPDAAIRTQAEEALVHAQKTSFPQFSLALATELHNESKPINVRQLAGITFKNLLVAKEQTLQQQKHENWKQLDNGIRSQIKTLLLQTLFSPESISRHTAAQACAEVAAVELPFQAWEEFLPFVIDNITSSKHADEVKVSTLECIGFTCERIVALEDENIPEITPEVTDKLLTAIVDGMQESRSDQIRLSATTALRNSLLFTKKNMDSVDERNVIMQNICQATQSKDVDVRAMAFDCLCTIVYQYYDKLQDYMTTLFQLSTQTIQNDEEKVALNAIEFWCTLCEEETDIRYDNEDGLNERTCMNYVKAALPQLGPLLTTMMTKQDEDITDDEVWNVSMAASTCLALIACTVEDDVVPVIVPFVQQHITNENWRYREAATMAFGSILDGPSSEVIGPYVNQSIPVLLKALSDSHDMVKDSTAWTLARICDLHVRSIPNETFPILLKGLVEKLSEESPQVASKACFALHNLAGAFSDDDAAETTGTNALSPYMPTLLEQLLKVTDRDDADEFNLRSTALETISVLIQNSAPDCMHILVSLLPAVVTRLQQSFNLSVLTSSDKEKKEGLQGLLCGVIQILVQKMDVAAIEPHADNIMTCFLQTLQIKNATCHLEAFSAISTVCDKMEAKFNKYVSALVPFLLIGLKDYQAYQVCTVIVGLIGDICRAIESEISGYCNEIMNALVMLLQDNYLHRDVKPPVFSCFGDIAMAITGSFEPFLKMSLFMLSSASTITVPDDDEELVEYLQSLREGILEAYTGIIQGLKDGGRIQLIQGTDVENMIGLLEKIASDSYKEDEVLNKAVGLLGDMSSAYGGHMKPFLQRPSIQQLMNQAAASDDDAVVDTYNWASKQITSILQQ